MVTQPSIDLSKIDWRTLSYAKIYTKDCLTQERRPNFLSLKIDGRIYFLKKQRTNLNDELEVQDIELIKLQQIGEHPYIIRGYGAIDIKGRKVSKGKPDEKKINGRYSILEYIQSSKDIREKEISPLEKFVCFYFAGLALKYMHSKGFVNLDVKPGNILVNGKVVKLIDVEGAMPEAQIVHENSSGKKIEILSSPLYCSPEAYYIFDYGKYSDVYSFGACINDILRDENRMLDEQNLRIVTKRIIPFPGSTREDTALRLYISGNLSFSDNGILEPKNAEEMRPRLEEEFSNPIALDRLVGLVSNMLERDKNNRPTMDEVVEEMEEILIRDKGLTDILEKRMTPIS